VVCVILQGARLVLEFIECTFVVISGILYLVARKTWCSSWGRV